MMMKMLKMKMMMIYNDAEHTAYSPSRQFPAIPSTYQGSNPSPAPWSVEKARSAWRSEVGWLSSKWLVAFVTWPIFALIIPPGVPIRNCQTSVFGVGIRGFRGCNLTIELPDLIRLRWANPWFWQAPANPIGNRLKILNWTFNWNILNFSLQFHYHCTSVCMIYTYIYILYIYLFWSGGLPRCHASPPGLPQGWSFRHADSLGSTCNVENSGNIPSQNV